MTRKNHLPSVVEDAGGINHESHGLHGEVCDNSLLSEFPLTADRWGISRRLVELGIDSDWLEQTYATANISMEHLRKDQYDLKPGIIAARSFFYRDVFCLDEVKLRSLKRIRTHWPRPGITFASLENFESHSYDSQKMAMLEPMIMTRLVDIPATEAVLRKNGFSQARIRRTLCTNPKTFHFNPQSLDQKLKYIKSLGLQPHVLVPKYPRLLNNRSDKIGANAAFFDSMTEMTDEIVSSTPSLLSMSEHGRGEVMQIRAFCTAHSIDPDKALKNIGGISLRRVATTHQLLSGAGLDADSILASRFLLVNYSAETLRRKLERVDRYLRFVGFDEAGRREFMQRNPQSFTASTTRSRYLARALRVISKAIPNVQPEVTTMTNLGIAVSKAGPELVINSLRGGQNYESAKEYVDALRKASRENRTRNKKIRDYGAYALKLKNLEQGYNLDNGD